MLLCLVNLPALDFLKRLLQFAPEKRLSVEQALEHPYLALLHDPSDEPVCDTSFDFSFEALAVTKEALKEMLWEETVSFEPPAMMRVTSQDSQAGDLQPPQQTPQQSQSQQLGYGMQ
jgi:mitogen-activated protein kinase 7